MNTVFSKNKEKRSRSSSNEANNSFVKNVTSRVSGLLPATITKWFSSPSSSKANGSAAPADGTDSSTEDEAPESPITTQPPSKRMRFSSPGKYNHYGTTDANCVPTNIDIIEQCTPYSVVQSPPGRTTFRRETNYASTPVRSPSEETVIERTERDSTRSPSQHSVSSVGPSVATKRKSLFGFPENDELSMLALRKTASSQRPRHSSLPSFNPYVYAHSSFYAARTAYGGASTYIDEPNIKQRKVAVVNESKSNDNSAMSQSARRVMDLLENYSSPLKEAKRISQFLKSPGNESLDGSTISGSPYVNKVMSYKTQELHVPNIATLLRLKQRSRLMDTTNAARQIIASHSSSVPDHVSQPYPSMNAQKEQPDKEASSKMTTKVKARVTRQHRGENIDTEEPMIPVNLPTAVLQIDKDNLPKFTFGNISQVTTPKPNPTPNFTITSPKPNPTPNFTITSIPISISHAHASVGETILSKPETISSNDPYKFSSPVRISSESQKIATTPPKFTFGNPERGIEKHSTDKRKDDDSSIVVGTSNQTEKLPIAKSKDWQCSDCWVNNKTDDQKCVCCGAQQPMSKPKGWQCPDCWVNNKTDDQKCVCCGAKQPSKETAKSSKCIICKLANSQSNSEKCVNCEKILLNNNTKTPALKPVDSSNWKCEDCWVSNDDKVDKCVCCGAKNPKKIANAPSSSANASSDWKCNDCWIMNKAKDEKCAACGGAKPGPSAVPAGTKTSNDLGSSMFRLQDGNMKDLVKSQSDKWECPSCLVRNENNRTKCVCCDADKPGLVKESDKKSFNFGMNTNTSFKFGIDPKAQESSATNKPALKVSQSLFNKPEESETNNNTLPKTPSFSFGIPAKKSADQIDTSKDPKTSETPKLGFTFGIPKAQSKPELSVTSIFGSTNKLTESVQEKPNAEKETSQGVPKVDFKFPAAKESPQPIASMFGSPAKSQENKDKPQAPNTSLLNPVSIEKLQNSAPLAVLPKVTSEPAPQNSTFTFSGIGLKPASNLFAPPASTTPSFSSTVQSRGGITSSPAVQLFQKPESTTASPLSMFQKPDQTAKPTVALFQKSDSSTTAAPPSQAATAPIFSFGSNAAQSVASPQSSFGSNAAQSVARPQSSFGSNAAQGVAPPQSSFGSNAAQSVAPPQSSFGNNSAQSVAPPQSSFGNNAAQSVAPPQSSFGGNTAQSAVAPQSSFGGNTAQSAVAPQSEKPNFNFTFGNTPLLFNNNTFNTSTDNNSSSNKFSITGNSLGGGNGLPAANPLGAGNSLTPSKLGGSNELTASPLNAGNEMPAGSNLFGAPAQKENLWSARSSNSNNMFVTSASTNMLQKPAAFTFGSTTPFNANNPTPAFGSNAAPAQNMFGMNQNASAQSSMFASPVQSQSAPSLFGNSQPASAPAPAMNLFGAPNVAAAPAFGAPNTSSLIPAPTQAFNFGAQPPSSGIFGFGQQPQQQHQMPQQAGVYSFGGSPGGPQMQFNMGSVPSTSVRRVRKAVRRNPPR